MRLSRSSRVRAECAACGAAARGSDGSDGSDKSKAYLPASGPPCTGHLTPHAHFLFPSQRDVKAPELLEPDGRQLPPASGSPPTGAILSS